jgi:pyruvate formate lyase activating enzyme
MGWEYKLKDVKENTPEQLTKAEKLFNEYFSVVITN